MVNSEHSTWFNETEDVAVNVHALIADADAIANNLKSSLTQCYQDLDLSKEELVAAHNHFKTDSETNPNDFWNETAVLRSGLLKIAAIEIINEATKKLEEKLVEFYTNNEEGQSDIAQTSIEMVFEATSQQHRMHQLGQWWQHKLYNAATRKTLTELDNLSPHKANAAITLNELALLMRPPWSYSDRLLAAFELSHRQISEHAERNEAILKKVFTDVDN